MWGKRKKRKPCSGSHKQPIPVCLLVTVALFIPVTCTCTWMKACLWSDCRLWSAAISYWRQPSLAWLCYVLC